MSDGVDEKARSQIGVCVQDEGRPRVYRGEQGLSLVRSSAAALSTPLEKAGDFLSPIRRGAEPLDGRHKAPRVGYFHGWRYPPGSLLTSLGWHAQSGSEQ
jgi:hypothetical protein